MTMINSHSRNCVAPISFLPMDRRLSLASNTPLPERSNGVAMIADISGFTKLAKQLSDSLGSRRGSEELIQIINPIYDAIIDILYQYRGSVIGFAGDSLTIWFDESEGDASSRAVTCALQMQNWMGQISNLETGTQTAVSLYLKIGLAYGPVSRYLLGDPGQQYLEAIAGETVVRMSHSESLASAGEVIIDHQIVSILGDKLIASEWVEGFAKVFDLKKKSEPNRWPDLELNHLELAPLESWVPEWINGRLSATLHPTFLGDLRPVCPIFLQFSGINFDQDSEASSKLNRFVIKVQDIIAQFNGALIDLTIGDKGSYLYLNIGAKQAHEDDAKRALEVALQLISLQEKFEYIEFIKIGVTRGLAWTGNIGSPARSAFVAMGEPVNLAARLMQNTPKGQIWVDYSIFKETTFNFEFESLAPIQVKGSPNYVRVYQPISTKPRHSSEVQTEKIVGRAIEISQLETFLDQVMSGIPQIMLIEGEAGIGKSTLIDALIELHHLKGLVGLIGAGQSNSIQVPYFAWKEVFNSYFGLDQIMEWGEKRQITLDLLKQIVPTQMEIAPLLNDILNLGITESDLTRSLPAKNRQRKLFELLTQLLQIWMEKTPLILVLEDAHWLDDVSWAFLNHCIQAFHGQSVPLGFVVVTRPISEQESGYAQQQQVLEQEMPTSHMQLTTMSETAVVELIAQKLGIDSSHVPFELVDFVENYAHGNPFYTEELVLTLQNQGQIVCENGWCHIRSDLKGLKHLLPDSLHGLILSRIDQLNRDEQIILKIASVIGRLFTFQLLFDLAKKYIPILTEDALAYFLTRFEAADFTYIESISPIITYRFKHVITQEATYQTMHFKQRRQLHQEVAYRIEGRLKEGQSEENYPILVYHFHYAEQQKEEQKYAVKAGFQAANQFANEDAIHYLGRGLDLLADEKVLERFDILLVREGIYDVLGQRSKQKEDLEAMKGLLQSMNDLAKRSVYLMRMAKYFEAISNYENAIEYLNTTIDLAQTLNDPKLEAHGYLEIGNIYWRRSKFDDSRRFLKEADQRANQIGDLTLKSNIVRNLGITYMYQREINDALAYFSHAYNLCVASNEKFSQAPALNNLGFATRNLGLYDQSVAYLENALAVYKQLGIVRGQAIVLHNLGECYDQLGQFEKAFEFTKSAQQLRKKVRNARGQVASLGLMGRLCVSMNKFELGLTYALQSIDVAQKSDNEVLKINSGMILALVLVYIDHLDEAQRQIVKWLQRAEAAQISHVITELKFLFATIYFKRGDINTAVSHLMPLLPAFDDIEKISSMFYPMRMFAITVKILRAVKDQRAELILEKGLNLINERANLLQDETLRQSFLYNIKDHQELVELAQTDFRLETTA